MSEPIILREYQETDRQVLEDIIRETWNYDRFCSPEAAAKMAKVYLNGCLANQTFTRVAVADRVPVGVIMGKNIQKHKCPIKLRMEWFRSLLSLFASKEGRQISKMFGGVEKIDRELLSACGKVYKGELAFFAISEKCRGKGLGRKLFEAAADYMKSQNISEFYLFTDTTCNYPFYEHLGLTRCCEKKHTIQVKDEKEEMTFFLYEYCC